MTSAIKMSVEIKVFQIHFRPWSFFWNTRSSFIKKEIHT
jgi:hypothetical protein